MSYWIRTGRGCWVRAIAQSWFLGTKTVHCSLARPSSPSSARRLTSLNACCPSPSNLHVASDFLTVNSKWPFWRLGTDSRDEIYLQSPCWGYQEKKKKSEVPKCLTSNSHGKWTCQKWQNLELFWFVPVPRRYSEFLWIIYCISLSLQTSFC